MDTSDNLNFGLAIQDFRRARQRAVIKEIMARLKGEPTQLLSYEEVRKQLKAQSGMPRGLKDIPLDAIIGSVNRYNDFTRDFLPLSSVQAGRWARVEVATASGAGVPPIEVYQIGEIYFVKDGNHRVSVARQFGAPTIQAYVTEIQTRVPLTPEIRLEDLIIKAEYAEFLDRTRLDEIRPEANLSVTVPGQYPIVEEHIAVHRYYMGLEQQREIDYREAVGHWYDMVYLPITYVIRSKGILKDFPNRTETDLYLWIADHRVELQKEIGREIKPEDAAGDLTDRFSRTPERRAARLGNKLLNTILPNSLDTGPSTGQWRKEKEPFLEERLFSDVLVAISGSEGGWMALGQAIKIAQREAGRLQGLHIKPALEIQSEELENKAHAIETEFNGRCQQAGVVGKMTILQGEVSKVINEQARWNDLVVVNLAHPPGNQPFAALGSGFRSLVQRCPRPILAIPTQACRKDIEDGSETPCLNSALLAFDGSPKANEALFVAAYLAGKWEIPLMVVTVVDDPEISSNALDSARRYLEARQVQATYLAAYGNVAESILETAAEQGHDLLLMGGYGHGPFLDAVLGNTVDKILRVASLPVLICR
jgi:nucleotide-binding universal stress UspA family protein